MTYNFSQSQISTAQQVISAAEADHATQTQILALMEAGLVESGMQNLSYGDRDSEGVFQERPSQGWTNVTNVTDATDELLAHMDTSLTDAGAMAQSAEKSAYPSKYDADEAEAVALLAAAGGDSVISGSTADAASQTDEGSSITDWLQSTALRVGMIVFGAVLMLVGMWVALGHSASSIPQAVVGGKQR